MERRGHAVRGELSCESGSRGTTHHATLGSSGVETKVDQDARCSLRSFIRVFSVPHALAGVDGPPPDLADLFEA